MKLTSTEIRRIIKIARDHPKITPEDIILIFIDYANDEDEPSEPIKIRPTPDEILKIVSLINFIPVDLVKSKNRKPEIVRVRQQYSLIAILFRYSHESISTEINRDHTSAHHSYKNAIKFCKSEPEYLDEVERIINKFPTYKLTLKDRLQTYNISVKCT